MGLKTAGVGHFAIPTAPAAGTSVTSGAANTFTTTPVVLSASAPSTLFITGVHLESSAALAATYIVVQLMSGGAGSEVVIGQYLVPLSTASTVALGYRQIYPPIPVASGTRLTAKTADSVGAKATLVTLECIAQANVVDDGIVQSANVLQWNTTNVSAPATAGIPDVNVKNINNVAAATPGAAGGLQIAGSNAATTYASLTSTGAFTVNGVAAVSQTGDSFARLGAPSGASVSADIAAVKTDTAAIKTKTDFLPSATAGAAGGLFIAGTNAATTVNFTGNLSGSVGSVSGAVGSVTGAVGSVTGNVGGNVVGTVASVTARVTANTDQLAGQTVAAAAGVTFPTSVASPTNITAGTITTVTNLTNAPTAGDFTATMKTSITTAASAATPTATLANGAHGGAAATLTLGGAGGLTATHTGNTTGSVGSVVGAVGSVTGNVGGNVTGSVGSVVGAVGSVTADVGITQAGADKVWSTAARVLTAGTNIVLAKGVGLTGLNDIAATAIVSSGAITTSGGKVSGVALVDTLTTYTGNTVQTGDSFARLGAAGAGLTALGDTRIANLDATVSSRSTYAGGAVASVTGAVGSVTAPVTVGTNNDKTGYALSAAGVQANWDALTASLTTVGSVGKKLADWTIGTAQTGDSFARLGAPAGASVSADIAAVKTDTAAIKTKTNSLTFSVAGYVDANIRYVNSVLVNGDGSGGTPWGP